MFIKHMVYEEWRMCFPKIFVFTDSTYNKFYNGWVHRVHKGFDEKKIGEIIRGQEKKLDDRMRGDEENIRVLIILDDVTQVKHSNALLKLCNQGRHLHISVIFSLQDAVMISREMRDQLDVVATFRQAGKIARERLIDGFLAVESSKGGEAVLREATEEKYSMLIIDNTTHSYDLHDFVYRYKVTKLPPEEFETCDTRNYAWLEECKGKMVDYINS